MGLRVVVLVISDGAASSLGTHCACAPTSTCAIVRPRRRISCCACADDLDRKFARPVRNLDNVGYKYLHTNQRMLCCAVPWAAASRGTPAKIHAQASLVAMTEQLGCLSPSHRRENLKGAAECGNGIPDFGFTGNPFYHHQIIKKLPTTAPWRVPSNESAADQTSAQTRTSAWLCRHSRPWSLK